MGIHNEPGTSKQKMQGVSSIVDKLLSVITDTTDKDRAFVPFKGVYILLYVVKRLSMLRLGCVPSR